MKKRIFCLALALLMLVGMLPVSSFAEGKSEYEKNETGKAVFNNDLLGQVAYITNDPTLGLDASGDYTITVDKALLSQTFYIADSYVGERGYWYKLEPLDGETMPAKLSAKPWVYQNDIPTGDYADTLIITPPANTCRCCESCTGAEDCECGCGECDYCEPTETDPTTPSTPENPCACCEDCIGAEDCECGCGECQFCEPTETDPTTPSTPENPCKCCENCTGAEDCECGCVECQFCEPTETDPTTPSTPENPCKCCENCTGAEDCECGCENCQFCETEIPDLPTLTDPETNVEVTIETLPEGVTLEVDPDADVSAQFSDFGIPAANQVFGLDITLTQGGAEYQPGGAYIKVPVDETIPVGTMIGIIHKHGNEVATFTGLTKVLSDHTVEFYTDSFSEFAGFTVDFHYEGKSFSIEGKTSILLSELFAIMEITEDAYSATSVVFSDNTLIGVEKQDNGDWLLTSLEAFRTEETLIITFTDGHTIVIDVTDELKGNYGQQTTDNPVCYKEEKEGLLRTMHSMQLFGTLYNSGVTAHLSHWGGITPITFKLHHVDGNTYTSNEVPAQIGVQFSFSGDYWYLVRSDDGWAALTTGDSLNNIGFANVWGKWAVIDFYSYSRITYNNPNLCTVKQRSILAEDTGDDYISRRVYIYLNGTLISSDSYKFPPRGGTSTDYIEVSNYDSNKYAVTKELTNNNNDYVVRLREKYTVTWKNGDTVMKTDTVLHGDSITYNGTVPSKSAANGYAYTFTGWDKGSTLNNVTANTTVNAQFSSAPVTYTATFNANGGSVTPTSSEFNIEGALALPTPTKAGYDFKGWKVTTAAGNWSNGTTYDENTTSIPKGQYGNVTFTAQWKEKDYTVNFNYNGGYDSNNPSKKTDSCTVTTGSGNYHKVDWLNPVKDGYTFTGWYTSSGTKVYEANGNCVAGDYWTASLGAWKGTTDLNLVAGWTEISYQISFNLNGATSTAIPDQTRTWGERYTLPNPTTGHFVITYDHAFKENASDTANKTTTDTVEATFNGWEDQGSIVYEGVTYKYTDFDAPFYGYENREDVLPHVSFGNGHYNKYGLLKHYILHGQGEGRAAKGSTPGLYPKNMQVSNLSSTAGYTVPLVANWTAESSITLPNITRTGYTLTGWRIGDTTYDVGATYTPTANVTAVAQWEEVAAYKVTYEYDGVVPDGAPAVPQQADKKVGDSVTVEGAPTPAPKGYTFSGWTTTDATVNNGKFTMPNKAVTFTGSWSVNQYTVTYQYADDKTDDKKVAYTIKDQVTLEDTPTRDGYEFKGWKLTDVTDTNWTAGTFAAGAKFNQKYGDVTFVAQWEAKNYTITYDLNDGSLPEGVNESIVTYDIEDPITLMAAPTREGYKFSKWNLADGLTAPNGNWAAGNYDASQQIAKGKYGNIELVAQWTDQYRYVLKFNANTTDQVSNMPQNADTNWIDAETYTFQWANVPTRENYDFLGWATSADAAVPQFDNSYMVTKGKPHDTEEVTLYAVWQRQTGDLKLTFNGDENKPAIVLVSGQGLDITLVLTKTETVIKDLPTGKYTVVAQSGRATYTTSVDPNSVTVPNNGQAQVDVTISGGNSNWFTAFFRVKNKHK